MKIGDRVKIKETGEVGKILNYSPIYDWSVEVYNGYFVRECDEEELIKERSNMKYSKGDVLVNKFGYERKILGVCDDVLGETVYLVSIVDCFSKLCDALTHEDLDDFGYKLKEEEKMIEVDGTKYSESTLKEMIRSYNG